MDLYEALCELVRSKIPLTLELADGTTSQVVVTGAANLGSLGKVTGTAREIRPVELRRTPGITMQEATDNLHRAMGPRESAFRKEHAVPEDAHTDMTQLAAFVDAQSSPDSAKITVSEPSLENQHAHMLHDMGVRAHTFQGPSALLKPFTPNKYTRYIPTLDGRKAPVDVYCVLAAFPTGSAAVDHAVKKLLAPGQRGHKDRIQDIKEARDSLVRAIELEEAVEG